ncbi:MAG TPA: hypothetical protein VIJ25_07630, partial [Methylococcales bacterium]
PTTTSPAPTINLLNPLPIIFSAITLLNYQLPHYHTLFYVYKTLSTTIASWYLWRSLELK